jgi:phage-related protein
VEKSFKFVSPAAKRAFLALPRSIQQQFGADLNAVQHGNAPFSDFKDVSSSVGVGSIELIENGSPAFRAVYCAKWLETVYILHAFTKTTNGVDRPALATARMRYKEMKAEVAAADKLAKR